MNLIRSLISWQGDDDKRAIGGLLGTDATRMARCGFTVFTHDLPAKQIIKVIG